MKQKLYWVFFVSIILIATCIRFYQLGNIPHGMTWDEAAIGYNGYAVLTTRRDEWLFRVPISFRSFGDYKAPLAIYLNGLFTAVFGMNLWAVRLPFALGGVLTIAALMLLTKELFARHTSLHTTNALSLGSGLLMALSPWHIHFSRAGFESGLSLMFLVIGLWMLTKYFFSETHSNIHRFWLISSVSSFVASLYSYHSAKIVTPLIVLLFILIHLKQAIKAWKQLCAAALIAGVLLLPLVYDSFFGQGLERLGSSILDNYGGMALVSHVLTNLMAHLTPNFLFQGATTTLRHGGGGWGVLLPTTYALVFLGLVLHAGKRILRVGQEQSKDHALYKLSAGWVLIGLLPAAIGEEIPHSNRALLALPGFLWLATLGMATLISFIKKTNANRNIIGSHHEKDQVAKAVLGSLLLVHFLFAIAFLRYYFSEFAQTSASEFKDGYIEAFSYITPYEDKAEKIIFTNEYGQPYIYALFVRKTNPLWYQGGSLIKYEFSGIINRGDIDRPNTVVVSGNTDAIPDERVTKFIYGSDGTVRFKIFVPETLRQ